MFVSKQTSSSCTKWRLQGDDSSYGKQLHAQSRELRILLPFMKIKAEEKWPQFPPAEKERSTAVEVYWTSYSCTHPLLPRLPQRLISASSPVQKSQTMLRPRLQPSSLCCSHWRLRPRGICWLYLWSAWDPRSYRVLHSPLSSSWTRICHSLGKIKFTGNSTHCFLDSHLMLADLKSKSLSLWCGDIHLRWQMLFESADVVYNAYGL